MKNLALIELNKGCIKALCGFSGARGLKILSASVKHIESDSPLDTEKAFSAAISEFPVKKIHRFFFYIPRNSITLRNLSFPSTEDEEISNIVQLHLTRQVPYPREDIIYDFEILKKSETGFTEMLLAITHRAMLRKYFLMFEKANIYTDEIRVSSFGLLSCANQLSERLGENDKANIFIDIDLDYSDFIVYFDKKILFSKSIAIGSKNLEDPKNLPKFIGDLRQSFTVFHTVETGVAVTVNRIYISGMLKSAGAIKEMLQKELNKPVDIVSLEDFLGPIEGMENLKRASEKASFMPLIGAFIDPGFKGLSFTTSEARMKKNIKDMARDFIYTGSVLIYFLMLVSFFSTGITWVKNDFLKRLNKEISTLEKEDSNLIEKTKKIKLVDSHHKYSTSFLYYYYNIAKILPEKVTLERIIFKKGDELTLLGRATDMAEIFKFISVLNESGYFEKVDLRYSRKSREGGKEISEFEINNFLRKET